MKIRWLVAGLFLVTLTACVMVTREDAANFDAIASNARATDRLTQTRSDVPDNLKAWVHSNSNLWTYKADWANGRQPTTLP